MALITPTPLPRVFNTAPGAGVFAPMTLTTLGASDTFEFRRGTGQILFLRNPTGGTLSPLIDGGDGVTVPLAGWGLRTVSGGYPAFAITTLQNKLLWLDTIPAFLQGTITITSGAGLLAGLLNPI
ncbi:hypothetical protein [Cypionkella sinensis]|uniref:Phage tail protein n=1 Tax=Cypionkella sinensis TaxID=1756043 RepID=A0ABV7IVE7_9RHOB